MPEAGPTTSEEDELEEMNLGSFMDEQDDLEPTNQNQFSQEESKIVWGDQKRPPPKSGASKVANFSMGQTFKNKNSKIAKKVGPINDLNRSLIPDFENKRASI